MVRIQRSSSAIGQGKRDSSLALVIAAVLDRMDDDSLRFGRCCCPLHARLVRAIRSRTETLATCRFHAQRFTGAIA
jgi:hypothetical protein